MFKIIKRIIIWIGDYKSRLYKGFVYSFFNSLFIAFPIMAGGFAMNMIYDDFKNVQKINPIWILYITLFIFLSVLGRFYTSYRRAVLQDSIIYELTAKQRIYIGDVLKRVPLGFFQSNKSGDITTSVTNDLSYLEMYGMKMIDTVINGYISVFTLILCLCFFNIYLAFSALIGVIFSTLALHFLGVKSKNNSSAHLKSQSRMVGSTIEYLKGIPIIKSFGKENFAIKNIEKAYEESKNINIKIEKNFVPFNCFHLFSLKSASVLLIFLSAYFALNGDMSIPYMAMMMIFSFVIFGHVETINNAVHVLKMIDTNMDKIEKIENAEFIDKDGSDIKLNSFDIKFDNVSFSYDKNLVLNNVSFNIDQNTTTAIIGPSGSGKTTICNLIARFYDIDSGNIFIGNENIKLFTCDSLLKNISMVFQRVYLFNDSIFNNIKFGNPNASREEVIIASKKARCHDFIMSFPKGYDTLIGESGASLSGGEKQRISIARAILKNSPIVILDEATASIDPENEHFIQEALNELTHGKTIIIIAHRLATIENADQILVLDNGKIVQKGIHSELIKENGLYKKFLDIRKNAEGWKILKD